MLPSGPVAWHAPRVTTEEEEEEAKEKEEEEEGEKEEEVSQVQKRKEESQFPSRPGWSCNSCNMRNQEQDTSCSVYEQLRQNVSVPAPSASAMPFVFGPTSQLRQTITFGTKLNISFRPTPQASESSLERDMRQKQRSPSPSPSPSPTSSPSPPPSPINTAAPPTTTILQDTDSDDVIIVSVELPSEEKIKMAEKYLLPPSFYNYKN